MVLVIQNGECKGVSDRKWSMMVLVTQNGECDGVSHIKWRL